MNRVSRGNFCARNTSKSSARLSNLNIEWTEITRLCIVMRAMCDPATQQDWPFSKQADQGFETG